MAAATKPQRLPSTALRELGSSRAGVKDTEYCGPQTANTGSGPSVQKFSFPNARQYAPYKTLATRWARLNASAVSDLFHATELYQLWNGALLKRTGSLLWPRQFVVVRNTDFSERKFFLNVLIPLTNRILHTSILTKLFVLHASTLNKCKTRGKAPKLWKL